MALVETPLEVVEAILSLVLLALAGTMAAAALLAQRNYRDLRFLSIGVALLILAVVGATSLFAALFPDVEPAFDVGILPLVLLVLMVILLNLPLLHRFRASRPSNHG
jgi:peptidoglycan/LPS O-acetylase OafA/YrhL